MLATVVSIALKHKLFIEKKKGSQNAATLRVTHTTPIPEIYWNSLGLGHLGIADKILVPNGVRYRGVPLYNICNYTACR